MRPLNAAVPGALASLLRAAPLSHGKVVFAWRTAVGPAMDRVTSVRLDGGVLFVDAVSPQWGREVMRSSGIILARLQTLLGAESVERIEVRS
jgi:Dna[CI] antecedent, DciA